MPKPRLKGETKAALFEAGLSVLSLYQMPQRDGRKLDRCAQPSDPWLAVLHDGRTALTARNMRSGAGATPHEAVLSAIGERSNFGPLEAEIDKLLAVLREG